MDTTTIKTYGAFSLADSELGEAQKAFFKACDIYRAEKSYGNWESVRGAREALHRVEHDQLEARRRLYALASRKMGYVEESPNRADWWARFVKWMFQ